MSSNHAHDSIVTEIVIDAAAEQIFDALTDPLQRVQWWGAEGKFQATHMESDLRPGGAWLMSGKGVGGQPFVIRGEYRTIERPRVLEFTWNFEGRGPQTVVRIQLEEKDGTTMVRLTHFGFASDADREQYQGWQWLLSLLQAHVKKNALTSPSV